MALVMGVARKGSFLGGSKRSSQTPRPLSVPEALGADAAEATGADAAEVTGAEVAEAVQQPEGQGPKRLMSTKLFHRGGQPSRYIGSRRWKVFQTFENPGYSNLAKLISIIVMATILMSTLTFIFESEACEPTSWLPANPTLKVFFVIEVFSVTVFSMCAWQRTEDG